MYKGEIQEHKSRRNFPVQKKNALPQGQGFRVKKFWGGGGVE